MAGATRADYALPSRPVEPYVSTTCAYCDATVEFLPPPPLDAHTAPSSYKVECATCGLRFLAQMEAPDQVHFPAELIDHILSLANDDKATIIASCLVSRSWAARATLILRRELRGEWSRARVGLLPQFANEPGRYELVRTIKLDFSGKKRLPLPEGHRHARVSGGSPVSMPALRVAEANELVAFLALCTKLEVLQFNGLDDQDGVNLGRHISDAGAFTSLPSVRKLEVLGQSRGASRSQPVVLAMVPNITKLHVTTIHTEPRTRTVFNHLTALQIGTLRATDVRDLNGQWFFQQNTPNLRHLFIRKYDGDYPSLIGILTRLPPLLQSLEIVDAPSRLTNMRPSQQLSLSPSLSPTQVKHLQLPLQITLPLLELLPPTITSLVIRGFFRHSSVRQHVDTLLQAKHARLPILSSVKFLIEDAYGSHDEGNHSQSPEGAEAVRLAGADGLRVEFETLGRRKKL